MCEPSICFVVIRPLKGSFWIIFTHSADNFTAHVVSFRACASFWRNFRTFIRTKKFEIEFNRWASDLCPKNEWTEGLCSVSRTRGFWFFYFILNHCCWLRFVTKISALLRMVRIDWLFHTHSHTLSLTHTRKHTHTWTNWRKYSPQWVFESVCLSLPLFVFLFSFSLTVTLNL